MARRKKLEESGVMFERKFFAIETCSTFNSETKSQRGIERYFERGMCKRGIEINPLYLMICKLI